MTIFLAFFWHWKHQIHVTSHRACLLLPPSQTPFVCLLVTTASDAVDVNVTPDKRQVMLQQEKLLLALTRAALRKAFEALPAKFEFNTAWMEKAKAGGAARDEGGTDGERNKEQVMGDRFYYADLETRSDCLLQLVRPITGCGGSSVTVFRINFSPSR